MPTSIKNCQMWNNLLFLVNFVLTFKKKKTKNLSAAAFSTSMLTYITMITQSLTLWLRGLRRSLPFQDKYHLRSIHQLELNLRYIFGCCHPESIWFPMQNSCQPSILGIAYNHLCSSLYFSAEHLFEREKENENVQCVIYVVCNRVV